MTQPSEAALLDRFRTGDMDAFADLVQRHQAPLLRHARSLLGAGSAYEDTVQEAFLKLAQSPPFLPEEALGDPRLEYVQLSSWLHKVTRNLCMDVMRSETRRKKREQDVAAHEATGGGMSVVEGADTRAAVEVTIGNLPRDQREVLVLRLLGEKSYREIAEITGKKIGTVGWLVSVGLKALSQELEPLLSGANKKRPDVVTEPGLGFGMVQGELS
ncbi:MAG: RNA polymerase sigma factor [bacterium]|nr:RNA polymerase sigma factor [bacterium]